VLKNPKCGTKIRNMGFCKAEAKKDDKLEKIAAGANRDDGLKGIL